MRPTVIVSPAVTQARVALGDARDAFEAAVRSLGSADGQTVVASDEVLSSLAKMVAAHAHLDEVDGAAGPAATESGHVPGEA